MSFKYKSVKEFWDKIPQIQKAETEVKKKLTLFKMPNIPITIGKDLHGEAIVMNLFDKIIQVFAKIHYDVFLKVGYINLDHMWASSQDENIVKLRQKIYNDKPLFELYPKPYCGRRLYQGHLPLLTVSDFYQNCKVKNARIVDSDCDKCPQKPTCHSNEKGSKKIKKANVTWEIVERAYKTLGGIQDEFDAEGKRIENKEGYKAAVAVDTFDVGVKKEKKTHFENINGKDVEVEDKVEAAQSFAYVEVNGTCYEATRKMLLSVDSEINAVNTTLPEGKKYEKIDCLFVTDEIKQYSNKNYMNINHIVFLTD